MGWVTALARVGRKQAPRRTPGPKCRGRGLSKTGVGHNPALIPRDLMVEGLVNEPALSYLLRRMAVKTRDVDESRGEFLGALWAP